MATMIRPPTSIQSATPYWARVYVAGSLVQAEAWLRRYCLDKGLCVNLQPTQYTYTAGAESGMVVELINYPRFPMTRPQIDDTAREILYGLVEALCQRSATMMTPEDVTYYQFDPKAVVK
jgi:hypothetical protein